MTSIESLIIEIEEDFKSYKDAGLIDRASLLRWGMIALNKFGQSILTKHEEFIPIRNGTAPLPDNFHSLHYALKCTPHSYYTEKDVEVLQTTMFWRERIESDKTWSSCDPCCVEESEKYIVENVYFNDKIFSFNYSEPTPLRLTGHVVRSMCTQDCKNINVKSEYEISINNKTLHTNFNKATVYLQYYGVEQDENGYYLIPETPRGDLLTYLEYHLKRRLLENILINGDDKNIGNQLQYIAQQEATQRSAAIRDVRYKTLTPGSYAKIARLNRYNIRKHEVLLPRF